MEWSGMDSEGHYISHVLWGFPVQVNGTIKIQEIEIWSYQISFIGLPSSDLFDIDNFSSFF